MKLDIDCPLCKIPLQEVDGDGFDVMYCRSCKIIFDIKLKNEEWEHIPTVSDALGTKSGYGYEN